MNQPSEFVAILTDRYVLGKNYLLSLKNVEVFDWNKTKAILTDGSSYQVFIDHELLKGFEISRYVLVGNPSSDLVDAAILRLR